MELEDIARAMGISAYLAHGALLYGNPTPNTEQLLARMRDIRPGDWVVEETTILMSVSGRRPALDAVGRLIKITRENVVFGDPDFVWDEAIEGTPHPTETCTYIRTLDDREFRWTNASFVSVPVEFPIRPSRKETYGEVLRNYAGASGDFS